MLRIVVGFALCGVTKLAVKPIVSSVRGDAAAEGGRGRVCARLVVPYIVDC